MKKDIEIPKVENVYVAAVYVYNETVAKHEWTAYLLNDNNFPIENTIIVCKGSEGKKVTSTMRHQIKLLPAKSFAKIEWLPPELLVLNNEFSVSFFADGKLLHHNFLLKKNSVAETNCVEIPLLNEKGILAE